MSLHKESAKMKTKSNRIPALLFFYLSLWLIPAQAADPIQTQYGINGEMEVDLLRVSESGGILTAVFAYRNTGSDKISIRYSVSEVYFLEKSEGKKYHVLVDSTGEPLATPLNNRFIGIPSSQFKPGARKLVWFKFPAPPEGSEAIDLVLPDALPFENIALSR
jgi:hypothetical protein